jgi:uncharacterized protein (DUF952 family)/RimJ/RimL family protein N-acetyltransferase
MKLIRPVKGEDADILFPLIYQSPITDSILWDGPTSLEVFRQDLEEREARTTSGEGHLFTILEEGTGTPVGSASIHPDDTQLRGDIGLWVGEHQQGKGYGTQVVRELVAYGFDQLGLEKIEAYIFTGNWASHRIFEKNGFLLEGTIRSADRKRGQFVDEWLFGITRQDYKRRSAYILHLCKQQDWDAAQAQGEFRPNSLAAEGFIHCSRPEQILDVANRYYKGIQGLVLLKIEQSRIVPEIIWEASDGDDFPHIYGPINLEAVAGVIPITPDTDGKFRQFPAI